MLNIIKSIVLNKKTIYIICIDYNVVFAMVVKNEISYKSIHKLYTFYIQGKKGVVFVADTKILEEYNKYQARIDRAIELYNGNESDKATNKTYEWLVDAIKQCAKIEAEIKGIN